MATERGQGRRPACGRAHHRPPGHRRPADISSLITKEIQLVKSELKISAKAGGIGIGLFAGAAFILVLAIIMLSVAIAYFINWNGEGLDLHWAFLIVFGFYVLRRRVDGLHRRTQGEAGARARGRRSARARRSRRRCAAERADGTSALARRSPRSRPRRRWSLPRAALRSTCSAVSA